MTDSVDEPIYRETKIDELLNAARYWLSLTFGIVILGFRTVV